MYTDSAKVVYILQIYDVKPTMLKWTNIFDTNNYAKKCLDGVDVVNLKTGSPR